MNQQQEENLPDKIQITQTNQNALLYSVDDVPPWHLSCLLGFQVFLKRIQNTNVIQAGFSSAVDVYTLYIHYTFKHACI